jgi:hypothetical protein
VKAMTLMTKIMTATETEATDKQKTEYELTKVLDYRKMHLAS